MAMVCLLSMRGRVSGSSVLGAIAREVAGPTVLRPCCFRPAGVSCALIPKFPEMAPWQGLHVLTQLHWVCGFSSSSGHSVHCCSLLVPSIAHLKSPISLYSSLGTPVQWSIPSPSSRGLARTCQSDAMLWDGSFGPGPCLGQQKQLGAFSTHRWVRASGCFGVCTGAVSGTREWGRVWAKPECCTQGLAQREPRLPADSVCSPGWSIRPFFSCYPFDLYCKQVALTDTYPLQRANVSKGSVNDSPMSV